MQLEDIPKRMNNEESKIYAALVVTERELKIAVCNRNIALIQYSKYDK